MSEAARTLQRLLGGAPVGLVGLGLIGGSIGLDLKALGVPTRAWVRREAMARRARERGLVDQVCCEPGVLKSCGLVLLCLPMDQLVSPSPALLEALPPQAVISDVGSVKGAIAAAWRLLDHRFVPGHPMAGSTAAGVEAGQAGMFAGRPWVLTPYGNSDVAAPTLVEALALALGAKPLRCEAAAHDRAVALISHLPVLVSAALLHTASGEQDPVIAALAHRLASSGFADTSRVGGGNPVLGVQMATHNRKAVLQGLAAYRSSLEQLEAAVREADWPGLQRELACSAAARPHFL